MEEFFNGLLEQSLELSTRLGVHAVEVHAIDERAAAFYRNYSFTPLLDEPLHLYLSITTIENVVR